MKEGREPPEPGRALSDVCEVANWQRGRAASDGREVALPADGGRGGSLPVDGCKDPSEPPEPPGRQEGSEVAER